MSVKLCVRVSCVCLHVCVGGCCMVYYKRVCVWGGGAHSVRARVCVCRLSRITCVYIWYAACLVCVRMCACVSSRDIIASAMTHHIPMRCPDRGRMTARALVLCMCPLHLCACACASVLLKSGITQTRHVGLDMYPRKETPSECSEDRLSLNGVNERR